MFGLDFGWPEFLLYALAAVTIFRIVETRHNPAASVSWMWAVVSLPLIFIPLYWFAGGKRVRGFSPSWGKKNSFKTPYNSLSMVETKSQLFGQVFAHFGSVYAPTFGNAKLLLDGQPTFEAIFSAIEKAEKFVIVQYYIFRSDKIGKALRRRLIEKARQGVKVYLLIDQIGSLGLRDDFLFSLTKSGVEFAHFLPIANFSRLFFINNRNHRKLVVIDGLVAFSGGLNIGEEYAPKEAKKWRDTHIQVEGPVVEKLLEVFCEDWLFATGRKLEFKLPDKQSKQNSYVNMQVVPTGPYDQNNIGGMVFSVIIQSAKSRLWVSTPFFIPDEQLQRDLEIAVLRGVDVRLLIPRKADKRFVHMVTLSYAEQMQRRGVKVYLYEPGFLHQKMVLIDDDAASVSTSNFDNRAMYLNFETNILVLDSDFASQVEKTLLQDLASSSVFEPQTRKIRKLIKLRDNGARILAPLL